VSDEPKPHGPLTAANALVHEAIDDALLGFLEGITALDERAATAAWDRFIEALERHARFEEAEIFPRYALLGPHPRGQGLDLFEADHVSLDKVVRAALKAIATIQSAEAHKRRAMITQLGPLLRVRNILEHHTLREERFLYPTLEASLSEASVRDLVTALNAAAHSSDRS
jgi:hemerythrin-like domain-containing protein